MMSYANTYKELLRAERAAAIKADAMGFHNKAARCRERAKQYEQNLASLLPLSTLAASQAGDGSSLPSPAPQIADAQHSQQVTGCPLPLTGDLHKFNEVM